jgi:hypothetical protein
MKPPGGAALFWQVHTHYFDYSKSYGGDGDLSTRRLTVQDRALRMKCSYPDVGQ